MRMLERWRRFGVGQGAAVIGGLVVLVGFVGLVFMGGGTSTVLSTVGNAITRDGATVTGFRTTADSRGAAGSADSTTAGDPEIATFLDASRPDLLVIRSGELELRVTDLSSAVDAAARQIEALGGYVAASEQSGTGAARSATITYRVPVASWDRVVADMRGIASDVLSADVQTQDVTANVVDLDARIANLRATERALQAIMGTAKSVKDVLDVQAELTGVRGEIEESITRRDHLRDQAAFSTLTVHFGLPPVPATDTAQRRFDAGAEIDRSVAQLVRLAQRGIGFGIWFAIVGVPIILTLGLGVLVALGGRRVWLRTRARGAL
jgi:hypothetical protein